ncbi:MAG: hypothetical protein WAM14_14110 [Candidatus Nitrosopolaris sp.]
MEKRISRERKKENEKKEEKEKDIRHTSREAWDIEPPKPTPPRTGISQHIAKKVGDRLRHTKIQEFTFPLAFSNSLPRNRNPCC